MITKSGIIRFTAMLLLILSIVAGFIVLIWSADRFIAGAGATARDLGASPLFIGLTLVGLGTSAPEMLVSGLAAAQGNPGLGIGNALGSNIVNMSLVVGATALAAPIALRSNTLEHEFPVLLGLMGVVLVMMMNGILSRLDGALLCLGVVPLLWWMYRLAWTAADDPLIANLDPDQLEQMPLPRALAWTGIGLVALLASSQAVIWGATGMAETLGVSDTVIGLSIIAIGTSLPELAASVAGVLKGEHDIAIGNVLGSNMFNLLVVLGLPGLIAPGAFDEELLFRDFPVMVGLTVLVMLVAFARPAPHRVGRFAGAALLAVFFGHQFVLYS